MFDLRNPNHNFDYEVVLTPTSNGGVSLRIPQLGLLAVGMNVAATYDELRRLKEEYLTKAAEADLLDTLPLPHRLGSAADRISAGSKTVVVGDIKSFVLKLLIVFAFLFALLGGVGIAVKTSLDVKGGKKFWTKVTEGLHSAAQPDKGIPLDQQAAILADLRAMVAKYKPFVDEIRPLFADQPPPACK